MQIGAAREVLAGNPFLLLLGIELESLGAGEAVCLLRAKEQHTRAGEFLHGGATAALIDTAMAFAAGTLNGSATGAVTVDLTIHYLRPIGLGETRARASVLRNGKRLMTIAADIENADGELAATALAAYSKIKTVTDEGVFL